MDLFQMEMNAMLVAQNWRHRQKDSSGLDPAKMVTMAEDMLKTIKVEQGRRQQIALPV